jgi:hypothetical protein
MMERHYRDAGPFWKAGCSCSSLFVEIEFRLHALDEVFGAPRWCNNSIRHCFAQLVLSGAGILRDREVLGESVGAVDCHSTGNPNQLAGFDVKHFCEMKIQNFVARLHIYLSP